MGLRRVLIGLIAGLGLLAVVGSVALAWTLLRPSVSAAALLISDGTNLRLESMGRDSQTISQELRPAQFRFPAVSPDGTRIAYVANDGEGMAIMSYEVATGTRTTVYSSSVAEPFDLAWSPDNRHLLFLAPGPAALVLLIVPSDGSAAPTPIVSGRNIYFAWSDDGSQLALHVGGHAMEEGRVALYRPGDSAPTPVMADPGFFQAPAFSRDGTAVYYIAQPLTSGQRLTFAELSATITRVAPDGTNAQPVASEKQAALRLVRSPVGDELAYIVQRLTPEGSFTWEGLSLVNAAGGEPRRLSAEGDRINAFFWSPDGRKIAYLALSSADAAERIWKVVDLGSGEVRELASFTPSAPFAELNIYFDAYQHGYTPWSPDSARLAYAADDGVYVVHTNDGTSEKIGAGEMVIWANR